MKKILFVLLVQWCTNATAQSLLWHLNYNESNGTTSTTEQVGGTGLSINNQFGKPERVPGVTGNALRTDGFTTWVSTTKNLNVTTNMTLETWAVLENYPADEEPVYANATPSAFISQTDGNLGFQLYINTFGNWGIVVNINGTRYQCQAPQPFPLYSWTHAAAVVNGNGGSLLLYLNGVQVASTAIPTSQNIQKASSPLIVGKSNIDKYRGIFLLNALNGALDETRIYNNVQTSTQLNNRYLSGYGTLASTPDDALKVSPIRFENDLQRPSFHAMPPSNWTNEPHGLVQYNGKYHLFYQRCPNMPADMMKHWGHISSNDLFRWKNERISLAPGLQLTPTTGYDMKGISSGDVWVENGVAHAFYTCVNHSGSFNPGIAHAISSDSGFINWTKTGPILDKHSAVTDMRDPYIFKDGSTYYMLIGANYNGSGGLDVYTSTDLQNWTRKTNFCTVPYASMDIGSHIWEMPVFEPLGNGKYILEVNPIGPNIQKYGPQYVRGVYWIGSFSNGQFTPDYVQPKKLDLIHGHLAPAVGRNSANQLIAMGMVDERRSSIAQRDAGWCHTFSLPRVWSLLSDNQTLGQAPAPEVQALRASGSQQSFTNLSVSSLSTLAGVSARKAEILAQVPNTSAQQYGLNIRVSSGRQEYTRIYYDAVQKEIVLDKTNSSLSSEAEEKTLIKAAYDENAFGKPTSFHVYLDNSIVDVFINEKAAFSFRIYPTLASSTAVELYSSGGSTTFSSVSVWGTDASMPAVTGLNIIKDSARVVVGTKETLAAKLIPANAGNSSISWSSSNSAIATVTVGGEVTGVATGTVFIRAISQDGGFKDSVWLHVLPVPSYSVYDFESGGLNGLVPSGTAFSAADVSSATSFWGGIPFRQQGSYHLWGHQDGGDLPIGTLQSPSFRLGGDGKIRFLIGGGKSDKLYLALYRQSDNALLMKAHAENEEAYTEKFFDAMGHIGTNCYIRAVDSATGNFGHLNLDNIRIPLYTPVTDVVMNKQTLTLSNGSSEQLLANVLPSNASNQRVSWASSNAAVAIVSNTGMVTAMAPGTALIIVTTQELSKKDTCIVTVIASNYLNLDFETGDLTGWTIVSGNAFSAADVTSDTNWGWGGPFNQQGNYHLWSFKDGGDSQVGEIRSKPFMLSGDGKVHFKIGGGNDATNLYVALCRSSDNAVLFTKTGTNNEAYTEHTFNAAAYIGESCYIKIVDNATGGFGHLNVDDFRIPVAVQPYLQLDFESGNLNNWTVVSGTAFSVADVCSDINWGWGGPFNQQGNFHLWGFKDGGDAQTGVLRSSQFTIGGDGQVRFLIGGGNDLTNLYVALCRASDHVELLKATGTNNEAYTEKTFNASAYLGTPCYIKLVDQATGSFGHLNVDYFRIPVTAGANLYKPAPGASEPEMAVQTLPGLLVYPVPVKDVFTINFGYNTASDEMAKLEILNAGGARVYTSIRVANGLQQLSAVQLGMKPGVYFLAIDIGGKRTVKKILVTQ